MNIRQVKFTINSRPVKLLVDPERSLLDVIREDLKLIGTKIGCDENVCGSCTVLIDGKPKNSCKMPVEHAEGKNLITIEGIGTKDNPDIIQKAFVNVGATQCGFCTPGMILTAKSILDENPDPTREQVKRSIKRNLCRCTGYKKIVDGILLAAKARKDPDLVREKDISEYRLGGRIPQRNSWEKVTGSLRFAQDIYLKDMCHAKVLRSPYFHAKVLSIDVSAAEALPDVVAVATAKDLKGPNRVKYIFQDFRVLADEKVRYFGEPVAIVVARTLEAAEEALAKIDVTYEELPAVTNVFEALAEGAPEVQQEDYPGNELFSQNLEHGDIEAGFKEADIIEENIFTTPANAHGYLEPDTGVAYIDDEGRVVIYACGQAPHYHRDEVARVLGLGEDEVRVVEDGTGGGFGARIDPFIQLLLGLAVYKARVPVKLQFTAEENFIGNCKRHPFWIKFKTGVRNDGKIVAHSGEIMTDAGAYALASPGVLMRSIVHSYGPYEIPNIKMTGKTVLTNNTPSSGMRGFGVSQMCFAVETQMNKICKRLNMNILDFAKLNGFRQGTVTATGQLIKDPPGYKEVIETIENHWEHAEKATSPDEISKLPPHIKRGKGFATTWYGIGKTGLLNLSRCNIEVCADGGIIVKEGAAEIGQGCSTVMALIAGEEMGLTLDRIEVIAADSLLTPDSDLTCASKHTFYTGNATLLACRDLKEKLFEAAAKELDVSAAGLKTGDGIVFSKEDPASRISFADLFAKGYDLVGFGEFVVPMDLLDQKTGQGTLYVVFTYGAAVVETEINTDTGEVKVLNAAVAFQCGRAINRLGMEGQMEGGVAMGVGFALKENYIPGETKSFKQYRIPRSTEIPETHVYSVEIPQGPGPFGAIGMGEAAHFPMAPAIVAAINDACGIWIHDLPAVPEKILAAIEKQSQ